MIWWLGCRRVLFRFWQAACTLWGGKPLGSKSSAGFGNPGEGGGCLPRLHRSCHIAPSRQSRSDRRNLRPGYVSREVDGDSSGDKHHGHSLISATGGFLVVLFCETAWRA